MAELKDNGERLDAHMGFKVGVGEATSFNTYGLYALLVFAAFYVLYLLSAGFKRQIDGILQKN